MADPHALYVVTSVVVLGLVVWVAVVLLRPPIEERPPSPEKESPSQTAGAGQVQQGDTKS
jgi:hypothetical protein